MNNFYLSRNAQIPRANELATYIQVNNQRWPVFDQEGTMEAFHRLIQATGNWNSTAHAVCIGADAYEGIHDTDLPPADAALATDATMWLLGSTWNRSRRRKILASLCREGVWSKST